ncbi:DUF1819 family protein [Gluconobacter sp. Dm-73]|uniref:DUF1819 family protein n=1 Tax=Gluconobacter sp. Dm-73 TaxID=2799802 RepID=UPI001B8B3C05|nr:DUF1819 family protein [Gluconobacter sp. Dm-73]MBS1073674.1 DUF1819 family protein [Gluconobacter sp. Dm-73]
MSYKADIAGGSLKLYESRIIAGLLLSDVSPKAWKTAIEVENVLQKTSQGTAKRQASLIRARLVTMTSDHWLLVRDGSKPLAIQANFAAAIAHSCLLRDFLVHTVRDCFRTGDLVLTRRHWRNYVETCRERDPDMTAWTQSTSDKLGDSVFQILAEVGMLSESSKPSLQVVHYQTEIMDYLRARERDEIVHAMQAFI